MHHGDRIAQRLGKINVFRQRREQRDLRLQLAASDYQSATVQDGVAGTGLGVACIVTGSRALPFSTKLGVCVHLEVLAAFGVQCNSLRPCGFDVLKMYYSAPV